MFAVTGTWSMDASMREMQREVLPRLVEGVRHNAGFVTGFWCDDVEEPDQSVTFVVFETLEQAQAFRAAVTANAPAQADAGVARQTLRIVEVQARA